MGRSSNARQCSCPLHSGKTQRQLTRELDVSDYSLTLWKKAYLGQQKPAEIEGQIKSPEEMAKIIREQHKEIEYLKRQLLVGTPRSLLSCSTLRYMAL